MPIKQINKNKNESNKIDNLGHDKKYKLKEHSNKSNEISKDKNENKNKKEVKNNKNEESILESSLSENKLTEIIEHEYDISNSEKNCKKNIIINIFLLIKYSN